MHGRTYLMVSKNARRIFLKLTIRDGQATVTPKDRVYDFSPATPAAKPNSK